ncbi:MAG: aminotransferase class V-fold PLP-dependent enzyme [Candidatus Pacebacteria bacterium]|nr:aminotransferase class V-fold PLP-dependent enzyme [Candidatus Paceibacterota bacterium]
MFFKPFKNLYRNNRIYLDYASSTPEDAKMLASFSRLDKRVLKANPSALHKEGVALKKILSDTRSLVAKTLTVQNNEIIFTSNATESDNLAILGFIRNKIDVGINPKEIALYISPFEHSAIESLINNIDKGIRVCKLVQEDGYVLPNSINIPEETKVVLISVMFVQNEIGTTQNIKEISKRIRKLRKEYPEKTIVFHTDATQAPLYYDLNVARLGVDMMTLGATKLYTPKGVGMLYKKRSINLSPIFYGGGQEGGLRPGTEPVELIHKFANALSYAQYRYEDAYNKTKVLQNYFENKIKKELPQITITGGGDRSPHITHLTIPDIDSELLVIELDARGIAVSSKSACKNEDTDESGIMELLYPNQNLGAIRISYGRKTTKRELIKTIKAIKNVLEKYKNI